MQAVHNYGIKKLVLADLVCNIDVFSQILNHQQVEDLVYHMDWKSMKMREKANAKYIDAITVETRRLHFWFKVPTRKNIC